MADKSPKKKEEKKKKAEKKAFDPTATAKAPAKKPKKTYWCLRNYVKKDHHNYKKLKYISY